MPRSAEPTDAQGESIKVGSTGTVAALMSRELDSIKHLPQASSSSSRRHQSRPVSVPCGAYPKNAIQRKSPNESGGGGGGSNNCGIRNKSARDAPKPRSSIQRIGCQSPILHSDEMHTGRNSNAAKIEKKGNAYTVEVVDLKCSNPMSSRLRKLGFSKLSESIA